MSPHTSVVVGTASDVPMVVDLVRDGPHGLVGGTSGSGQDRVPQDAARVAVPEQPPRRPVDRHRRLQGRRRPRRRAPAPPRRRRRDQPRHRAVPAHDRDAQGRVAPAPGPARLGRGEQPRLLPHGPSPPPRAAAAAPPDRRRRRVRRAAGQRGRARAAEGAGVDHPHRPRPRTQPAARHAELRGRLAGQIDANAGLRICLRVGKPAHSKAVLNSGHRRHDPRPLRRPGVRPLPRP